ncbi:MAG: twin-arginine translocase TatA/TatE family subunit [Candidatus Eremiobacteraeota bacterium]|nr:twin-arginine translocase TatA/TatE family subunit [Candidatus Eremiobacteraeota bacterium]MCW5868753.1 twin-arginine translocase TatA/TatE family subunit [Candidatus Eremiobacteraeota bacterium]
MFGLGIGECIALVLVFALIFGPRLMISMGSRLASSLTGFHRAFRAAELPKLPAESAS